MANFVISIKIFLQKRVLQKPQTKEKSTRESNCVRTRPLRHPPPLVRTCTLLIDHPSHPSCVRTLWMPPYMKHVHSSISRLHACFHFHLYFRYDYPYNLMNTDTIPLLFLFFSEYNLLLLDDNEDEDYE